MTEPSVSLTRGTENDVLTVVVPRDTTDEAIQRLIAQADGYAREVERLTRERDAANAQTLNLVGQARSMRALLVEADSNLGLWRHRYDGVRMPQDLRDEVDDLRRRLHPYVAAGGRGATGDTAGSNPVGSGLAGSNPAAPTDGAVQVSPCPICGNLRTMSGNVASCLLCGGTTRPVNR